MAMGMDEGVATLLPQWCVDFFESFDWDRDRLMTLLTSLPCRQSVDVPHGQLCHPEHTFCSLCAPKLDTSGDPVDEAVLPPDVVRMEVESARRNDSSSAAPRTLRPTKYGRCSVCGFARKPWIFRSGSHAGQAAFVCTNLLRRHGKKCFKFQIMSRTDIDSMNRYFRSQHASVENRLKRAGRADAQAHA